MGENAPAAPARELLTDLSRQLGSDRVITAKDAIARQPGFGWLRPRRPLPLRHPIGLPVGIVRPRESADVALVLRLAGAARVPVVPYGGGTGVMGGALTEADGIALDLGAMNRIVAIEPENRVAKVETGVILADLAGAADDRGLLFAHDPWSQSIATVGGAISTSGMGYLAAGYGSMGQQVLGLEVVLPTGEIVHWAGAPKTSTGPDLTRLFVGAEGTLGVITSAVVQLFSRPLERILAAFRFPSFADGWQAINDFVAAGLRPSMVDYEEIDGPPLTTPADLHLAFDGLPTVVRAALRAAGAICRERGGTNLGRRAAEQFWASRHRGLDWWQAHVRQVQSGQVNERSDDDLAEGRYVDVVVPAARALEYCGQVVSIATKNAVDVHTFGVWVRPELISYFLEGPGGPDPANPLDRALDEALRLARSYGGSIEYVHGVGVRLARLLPDELGPAYDLLRRLKAALDPTSVLNPGKLGLG
jgi:FAD/FMN-containing dehydrogenase